jgi:hypothetical protein
MFSYATKDQSTGSINDFPGDHDMGGFDRISSWCKDGLVGKAWGGNGADTYNACVIAGYKNILQEQLTHSVFGYRWILYFYLCSSDYHWAIRANCSRHRAEEKKCGNRDAWETQKG